MNRIGFMQGRLSPLVDGKIQAFPKNFWRDEFVRAQQLRFPLMEWTIDHQGIEENPLMTRHGRAEIAELCRRHEVEIRSLTGDCFMQAPFYKAEGMLAQRLLDEFLWVIDPALALNIRLVVMPLVDAGSIENRDQSDKLRAGLDRIETDLRNAGAKLVFESDLMPMALQNFIADFPPACFGINYDIGNSASLGHDPNLELTLYGSRIDNVHVKDGRLGGTTVPLGEGAADLPFVFGKLREIGYSGDYILQTARAADHGHDIVLAQYRDLVRGWLGSA